MSERNFVQLFCEECNNKNYQGDDFLLQYVPESEWCDECQKCAYCCKCNTEESKSQRFIRNLNMALSEYLFRNPEEMKAELKDLGIDQDEIVKNGLALIEKLKKEAKLLIDKDSPETPNDS